MPEPKISKARLILNGIGCFGIAMFCLPIGISGVIGLAFNSTPMGSDPDGKDKVLALLIFCGFVGAIALISFIRTVKIWRGLSKNKC